MNITARDYQIQIKPLLKLKLAKLEVENEWIAFRQMDQYSPRVDIAVGPFSTTPGEDKISEYNELLQNTAIERFLRKVYDYHILNLENNWSPEIAVPVFEELVMKNQNARCFIAFEIENRSSRKHIMGSIINAASLGRIGIGIAYNKPMTKTFIQIMKYLAFLKRVGKNSYDTTNFLVITVPQLQLILNETHINKI